MNIGVARPIASGGAVEKRDTVMVNGHMYVDAVVARCDDTPETATTMSQQLGLPGMPLFYVTNKAVLNEGSASRTRRYGTLGAVNLWLRHMHHTNPAYDNASLIEELMPFSGIMVASTHHDQDVPGMSPASGQTAAVTIVVSGRWQGVYDLFQDVLLDETTGQRMLRPADPTKNGTHLFAAYVFCKNSFLDRREVETFQPNVPGGHQYPVPTPGTAPVGGPGPRGNTVPDPRQGHWVALLFTSTSRKPPLEEQWNGIRWGCVPPKIRYLGMSVDTQDAGERVGEMSMHHYVFPRNAADLDAGYPTVRLMAVDLK
jgi:hypothetical protein